MQNINFPREFLHQTPATTEKYSPSVCGSAQSGVRIVSSWESLVLCAS